MNEKKKSYELKRKNNNISVYIRVEIKMFLVVKKKKGKKIVYRIIERDGEIKCVGSLLA